MRSAAGGEPVQRVGTVIDRFNRPAAHQRQPRLQPRFSYVTPSKSLEALPRTISLENTYSAGSCQESGCTATHLPCKSSTAPRSFPTCEAHTPPKPSTRAIPWFRR